MKTRLVVVDASYVLGLLFPDEKRTSLPKGRMVAPALLAYEVANALKTGIVRKRIDLELARHLLGVFRDWGVEMKQVEEEKVMEVAIDANLSVYDASYVWLARKLRCPLLTWDKKLSTLV